MTPETTYLRLKAIELALNQVDSELLLLVCSEATQEWELALRRRVDEVMLLCDDALDGVTAALAEVSLHVDQARLAQVRRRTSRYLVRKKRSPDGEIPTLREETPTR